MPKLIVMLRIKDGMFFLPAWLDCFEKLADEIVVLDNGSTDGCVEMLKAHPRVADLVETSGYNEGRDKNLLYARVRARKPDWCLWVDVDEIFEPGLTRHHLDELMSRPGCNKFMFRRFHFIDHAHFAGSWFRLNYSAGHDRMLWREYPSGYFEDFILDSPNVKGIPGRKRYTHYRLKHLGYINRDLVDQKVKIYSPVISADKRSSLQEMYLQSERKVQWIDNAQHWRVRGLNYMLDVLLLRQFAIKAFNRVTGLFRPGRKAAVVVPIEQPAPPAASQSVQ